LYRKSLPALLPQVFNYFKTPLESQGKVLNWGIASAAVLRLAVIVLGTELIANFRPVLLGFALMLLYSAWGLLSQKGGDTAEDLSNNAVVRFCRRLLPVSDAYDGDAFFTPATQGTEHNWGGHVATPLLLALVVVELSDVLFAVDSIPAVFGVTLDPFIIYTRSVGRRHSAWCWLAGVDRWADVRASCVGADAMSDYQPMYPCWRQDLGRVFFDC